jgi:site-specific DNA-methyltransferase (adenine-specific)
MGKKWDYDVPSVELWAACLRVLKPGAPLLAFGGSRTFHRIVVGIEDAGFEVRDTLMWLYGKGFPKSLNVGKAVEAWAGYGTALKPAHEPICLARKPLSGTVAENVTCWGVGALAIDACRIGDSKDVPASAPKDRVNIAKGAEKGRTADTSGFDPNVGRWPANLLFDEDAAAILDEEVGPRKSGLAVRVNGGGGQIFSDIGGNGHKPKPSLPNIGYMDGKTNPSRFFYTTKVGRKERELGCGALPEKSAGEMTDREDACTACEGKGRVFVQYEPRGMPPMPVLDNCKECKGTGRSAGLESPRAGAGRTGGARNHHPTLKPISLTEYLARLIKPPIQDACLLVPFAGAGSEMIGALKAGWPIVVGIEREADYIPIAHARIAAWCPDAGNDS